MMADLQRLGVEGDGGPGETVFIEAVSGGSLKDRDGYGGIGGFFECDGVSGEFGGGLELGADGEQSSGIDS